MASVVMNASRGTPYINKSYGAPPRSAENVGLYIEPLRLQSQIVKCSRKFSRVEAPPELSCRQVRNHEISGINSQRVLFRLRRVARISTLNGSLKLLFNAILSSRLAFAEVQYKCT